MNITFVTHGFFSEIHYKKIFKYIADKYDSTINVICLYHKYWKGLPVPMSIDKRIEMLINSGASSVSTLPEYTDLLDDDSLAFAININLQDSHKNEVLAIPVLGEKNIVNQVADFMFKPDVEYQKQVKDYQLSSDIVFYGQHIPFIMEKYLPGSEEFLNSFENFKSMKYNQSLRGSYNPTRPELFFLQEIFSKDEIKELIALSSFENIDYQMDKDLFKEIRKKLLSVQPDLLANYLTDITHGNELRTRLLIDTFLTAFKEESSFSFTDAAKALASARLKGEDARNFLLMCLTGFRKIDNTVYMLHGYNK